MPARRRPKATIRYLPEDGKERVVAGTLGADGAVFGRDGRVYRPFGSPDDAVSAGFTAPSGAQHRRQ